MSKNQAKGIHFYSASSKSAHPESTSKKNKTGYIVGLVPQRRNFSSEEVFQQVMDKYIPICKRLEMVKRLEDCMKSNG